MEDLVQKILPLLQNVKTFDTDLLKNVVKTLRESVSAEQKGLVLEALREAVKRWQQETKGVLPFELEATFDIVVDTVFLEFPTVEAVVKSSFVQKLLALFCAHCCSASSVAVEVATVASVVDEVVAVAGEAVTVAAEVATVVGEAVTVAVEAATVAGEAATVVPEVVAVAVETVTVVSEVVAVVSEVVTVVPETPVATLTQAVEVSTTVAPVPLSQVKDLDVVLTSVLEPEMASRRLSMRSQRRQYN